MFCRRCPSADLIALEVFHPQDYPVYRCRRCGFLFSPGPVAADSVPASESAATRKPATPESAVARKPVNAKSAVPARPAADAGGRRRRDS